MDTVTQAASHQPIAIVPMVSIPLTDTAMQSAAGVPALEYSSTDSESDSDHIAPLAGPKVADSVVVKVTFGAVMEPSAESNQLTEQSEIPPPISSPGPADSVANAPTSSGSEIPLQVEYFYSIDHRWQFLCTMCSPLS